MCILLYTLPGSLDSFIIIYNLKLMDFVHKAPPHPFTSQEVECSFSVIHSMKYIATDTSD